ncbi:FtsX-like permease family protein [Hoyosella subflava]|uniref:ABC3 transporter permease C-terminal domain-containing protein n=1 Tax=Hoyosella subflava (strain DSM 45089 / JCM 17490 / NBRC 109087 / DQS3-9A1) TaxID=443218 RepID=F6EH06_HOYSD|nr:FtsX-like permease family protein [Hoyosella subflava]AEF38830.1 hypothetical protein AS9A_0371 [Hoyosella subflava DQS3-9A1]
MSRAALGRWWLLHLRELIARPIRSAISIGVIAVSSALLVAVLSTYGSLTGSVDRLSQAVAGDAALEVTAIADTGFDDRVLPLVRRVPGVETAAPLLWAPVAYGGRGTLIFGADQSAGALGSDLVGAVDGDLQQLAPELLGGGVIAGPGAGVQVGDVLRLPGGEAEVIQVSSDPAARPINSGNFLVTALPVAQRLAGREGTLDSIFIIPEPGVPVSSLQERVTAAIDGRALVAEPEFRAAQAGTSIALTRDSTLLVALIGLVVAGFLVFNSMNMTVAQRRPAIATLRALGAQRAVIVRGLVGEAALIGLIGGVAGIPLGAVMGELAVGRVPPVLVQSFSGEVAFAVQWYAPIVALILCVGASVVASAVAARQVFSVAPVEALQPADVVTAEVHSDSWTIPALIAGAVTMAVAVAMAFSFNDRKALLAGALFAVGILGLCYGLIKLIGSLTSHVAGACGPAGRLGAESASRAPRRVWATAMTVMIAVAVAVSTTGSMRNLVESAGGLVSSLADADFYLTTAPVDNVPAGPVVPDGVFDDVAAIPGISRATPGQWAYANLGAPDSAPLKVMVLGASEGSTAPALTAMSPEMRQQVLGGDGIALSRQLARSLDVDVGDSIDVATPSGLQRGDVVGVVDYLAVGAGMIAMDLPRMQQWYERDGATFIEAAVAADADPAEVLSAVESVLPEGVYLQTGQEAFLSARQATEQAGALAVGVQWIVALVAAVALLNTLMLSVLDRRRELGVLRAMGASRKFISRTVLYEALAVGVVGGAMGLLFGTALHYIATVALSATTAVQINFALVPVAGLYAAAALLLALGGALVPAWRAGRMDIISAVSAD